MDVSLWMELNLMKAERPMVVFTDLDGTLLDHETYSFAAARRSLNLLRELHIPLVFCSSKTRAEIELLQQELEIQHPFISENGGALFVPLGYFPFVLDGGRPVAGYVAVEFGVRHAQVVKTLRRIAREVGISVSGFSDMSIEEITATCGLSPLQAHLARLREYDEPFRILHASPADLLRLHEAVHETGLTRTRGGRFDHLHGATDKGLAVRTLKLLYERAWGDVRTVGLGDSLNDLSLLQEVDVPVIVRNPAAGATSFLLHKVPTAFLTGAPGPRGWNEAILKLLGTGAVRSVDNTQD